MILTVTLNPLLEHRLAYKVFNVGQENRGASEFYKAGGKGINVSRQLDILSINNLAFTFLGGNNGKFFKKILSEEKINFTSISTNSETRSSAIIIDESKKTVTSFFGNNPRITALEAEEFKTKLAKMIINCEMVIFSGSSPCPETNTIFPFGIQTANQYDKISYCDTYGNHLTECIESSPTIIHNNIDEVEKSLKISFRSEKAVVDHLKFLQSRNVKQAFITDGANPTYAANYDFLYRIDNPQINTIDSTGSGDAFTAGIAYAWHNNLPFEQALIFASALGVANAAKYNICDVSPEEADQYKNKIEITSLGKKMSLVDVRPT
jgi:1-phosphofructokinase family hexose kinase